MLNQFKKELDKLGNKEKVKVYARFFKTGPGEYGEGDVFICRKYTTGLFDQWTKSTILLWRVVYF